MAAFEKCNQPCDTGKSDTNNKDLGSKSGRLNEINYKCGRCCKDS